MASDVSDDLERAERDGRREALSHALKSVANARIRFICSRAKHQNLPFLDPLTMSGSVFIFPTESDGRRLRGIEYVEKILADRLADIDDRERMFPAVDTAGVTEALIRLNIELHKVRDLWRSSRSSAADRDAVVAGLNHAADIVRELRWGE